MIPKEAKYTKKEPRTASHACRPPSGKSGSKSLISFEITSSVDFEPLVDIPSGVMEGMRVQMAWNA